MNELVKHDPGKATSLVSIDKNAFELLSEQLVQTTIVGQLLKFTKGDWSIGKDNADVPLGTKFVINMNSILVGWVKWANNRPDQQIMHPAIEMHRIPKRAELGDTDEDTWELGSDGRPRDPWQETVYMIMKPPGEQYSLQNAITFSTASWGGRKAVAALSKIYGAAIRGAHPNDFPVIEIGTGSRMSQDKSRGKIKEPILKVCGWESSKYFESDAIVEDEEPVKSVKAPARKKK